MEFDWRKGIDLALDPWLTKGIFDDIYNYKTEEQAVDRLWQHAVCMASNA